MCSDTLHADVQFLAAFLHLQRLHYGYIAGLTWMMCSKAKVRPSHWVNSPTCVPVMHRLPSWFQVTALKLARTWHTAYVKAVD